MIPRKLCSYGLFENRNIVFELGAGQVLDCSIEGHQHTVFFDCQSEQIGICHLLVAGNAVFGKGDAVKNAEELVRLARGASQLQA